VDVAAVLYMVFHPAANKPVRERPRVGAAHLTAFTMASAPEYVVKPCVGIRRLFDAAVEAAGAGGPDPDSDWGVPAAFRRQLSTEEAIAAVRTVAHCGRAGVGRRGPPTSATRERM